MHDYRIVMYKDRCSVFKTHQRIASRLPNAQGYRLEWACHPQPQIPRSTRGLGGVTMFYKKELHDRVHVVHKDIDVWYIWIRIERGDPRELYIEIFYFPPPYSWFTRLGESPYLPLYDDTIR